MPCTPPPTPASRAAPVAADVDAVRFDTALRGYRMDEVDVRLEALRDDLAERERVLRLGSPASRRRHPATRAGDGMAFTVLPHHPWRPTSPGRR